MSDSQPLQEEVQTPAKRTSTEDMESDRPKTPKVDVEAVAPPPQEEQTSEAQAPVEKESEGVSKPEEVTEEKDTQVDEPAEPALAPASQESSRPSRARRGAVDPTSLSTLKRLYEEDYFDQVAEDEIVYPYKEALNDKVIVWRGDITKLAVGAIVNAANRSLLGGGGVDGAIHSAAGDGLYQECKTLNGADTGESKITGGHDLPADNVIHTVGPMYSRSRRDECEEQLRSCYQTTLELAVASGVKTLAFSGISTGIYGYPLDAATCVALDVTRTFLDSPEGDKLDLVIFTVFRQIDVDSYVENVPRFFPPPSTSPPVAEVEPTTTSTVESSEPKEEVKAEKSETVEA